MSEIVGLLGPGGWYLRIDPANPTSINFDRTSVGAYEKFELMPVEDKYALRAVEANVVLNGAPEWRCGTDFNRQFETRPVDAIGAHEKWTVVEILDASNRPTGHVIAYVDHEKEDRRFTSAVLSVVRGV